MPSFRFAGLHPRAIRALTSAWLLPLAHRFTVSSFQFAENDRGKECHPAKHKERLVDAVNELLGIGPIAIGKEEGSYQRRRSDALDSPIP
ncbi:MAG: hypothetical protein WBQ10_00530 [Terriglobales bacterium]